jgi:hypothetical protein
VTFENEREYLHHELVKKLLNKCGQAIIQVLIPMLFLTLFFTKSEQARLKALQCSGLC